MRHLTVTEYGHFLGTEGERLVIRNDHQQILETPLSRLRSITITKKGIGLSSNLIVACANRGIRIYLLDWRGLAIAALTGTHQHAIAALRKAQFQYIDSPESRTTAAGMIYGKLRNQRAVLLYFNKYQSKVNLQLSEHLKSSAEQIEQLAERLRQTLWQHREQWREEIMGIEGAAASLYWQVLKEDSLTPTSFQKRQGRGSTEITDQLLNYGYTLLSSYIWSALDNAGFELYAGLLHQERAGKPSLVLDMMEEYRAWVVDRNVIKLRAQIAEHNSLNTKLKKELSNAIHQTFANRYHYKGKRLKLETILQRQAYRLAASVVSHQRYQPYRFKW